MHLSETRHNKKNDCRLSRTQVNREFDRFRTCDHQSHNLALYLLSYKLHVVAGAGFEPASGFWPAQLMRLVSWATTLSRDFAEAEGFEPPTFGFGDRHSTN